MSEQTWQRPEWWCPVGQHPQSDDAYFENMCRIVFQAGLNWSVIEKKWQTMRKAFANFNIDKVAAFTNQDVERLLKDEGVVRHRGKIEATIQNALRFKEIQKQDGNFRKYLSRFDKSNNYQQVVNELTNRFRWLGPSSAQMYLHTVGENIKHEW